MKKKTMKKMAGFAMSAMLAVAMMTGCADSKEQETTAQTGTVDSSTTKDIAREAGTT